MCANPTELPPPPGTLIAFVSGAGLALMQKAPLVLLVFVAVSGVMPLSALAAFRPADVQVAYVSVEPARQLAYRLDIAGLNAFATADPTDRGAFVSALAVGGSLLVVRAQHPAARELTQKIQKSQYYEVFVALRGTPTASGRVVVIDAGADGILSSVPGAKDVDIVEEDSRATRFDGDLAAQQLSASEYDGAGGRRRRLRSPAASPSRSHQRLARARRLVG